MTVLLAVYQRQTFQECCDLHLVVKLVFVKSLRRLLCWEASIFQKNFDC